MNSIKYRGNHYKILRGGKPVASICPVEWPFKERTLGELKGLIKKLPHLGEEAEKFDKDLKEIIKHQPLMPEKNRWLGFSVITSNIRDYGKIKGLKVEQFSGLGSNITSY